MKIFNRIIVIINTLLFLVVGFFCLSISINQRANLWTLDMVQVFAGALNTSVAARIIIFIFGVFLIAVALLTIIGNIENRRAERSVILQSPHGDIQVSLSAIEDFSRIVKSKIKSVKDIKGRVRSTRKGLDVTARVVLFSDRSVADITQEIQREIIEYIKYTLGIDAEIKPRVIVNKMVYKHAEGKENE